MAPQGNTGHAHGQKAATFAVRSGSLRLSLPGIGIGADTLIGGVSGRCQDQTNTLM